MGKPFRGRLSEADKKRRINAAFDWYGIPQFKSPVSERQARIKRPVDGRPIAPLEKDIQKTILAALALRRDVVFVGRFNRGQAVATDGRGETRYTPFNSVPGFPDIHGLLVGGRAFYIEVKRPHPNYEKPSDVQQRFLDEARAGGAAAGVAVSVEEAEAILA